MKDVKEGTYYGAIRFTKDCRLYVTMPLLSKEPNTYKVFKKGECFIKCLVTYIPMYCGSKCNVSYDSGTYTFEISSSLIEHVTERVALIDNFLRGIS